MVSIVATGAEGEGPAARLQPRLPQIVAEGQLRGHRAQGLLLLPHGLAHPGDHRMVQGLRAWGQGPGLGRVPGEVEEQRRAVHGDALPETGADSVGLEVRRYEMDLPEPSA